MKKGDFLILFIIITMIIGYFIFFINGEVGEDIYLVIKVDNTIVHNIKLEDNQYQEIIIEDYGYNVIIIDNYEVYMHESDCPNQDCVHTGTIKPNPGLFEPLAIICAPNHVSLSFSTSVDGAIDEIVN